MHLFETEGISVRGINSEESFVVDPQRKTLKEEATVFITHAHSDHAFIPKKIPRDYFMSVETRDLLGLQNEARVKVLDKPLNLGDFEVSMHDAGHILGSRQVKFANGSEVVCTGDFKLEDDLLFKGAEILPADYLVVEATFGNPGFVFPSREETYIKMALWTATQLSAGASVILSGYKLGKGQELTKFVSEYLNTTPIVHPQVFHMNEVHKLHGINVGDYVSMSSPEALEIARDPAVFIIPPSKVNMGIIGALSMQFNRRFVSAFASGWSGTRRAYGWNKTFPLSSHADFPQLMDYIKTSEPKKVFTAYGGSYVKALSKIITKHTGIASEPLSPQSQVGLTAFLS